MSRYRGCVMLRRRAREARAVAALVLVCGLALLAGSAGCGADARGAAAGALGRPRGVRAVHRATRAHVPEVTPDGAQPVKTDPRPAKASGVRDTVVGGGARLYAVSLRWRALLQFGRDLGAERIVLASADGRQVRVVRDGAVGRSKRLAITGVRVSDSYVVWEETSQYDLELGGAARWRLLAAPIEAHEPTLGAARVIDSGVVAQRPRCDFALSGSRLVIASSRLTRSRSGAPAVRAALTIVELATGSRCTVYSAPGVADTVSWGGDRIVATVTGVSRARRASVIVLDDAGRLLARVELARGLAFSGAATARGDLIAAPVASQGSNDGALFVFSSSGLNLWKGGPVAGGLQWMGERVVFARPGPANGAFLSSVVVFDPISGAEHILGSVAATGAAVSVAVLAPGSAAEGGPLVYGLEPVERSITGDDATIVRSCLVR